MSSERSGARGVGSAPLLTTNCFRSPTRCPCTRIAEACPSSSTSIARSIAAISWLRCPGAALAAAAAPTPVLLLSPSPMTDARDDAPPAALPAAAAAPDSVDISDAAKPSAGAAAASNVLAKLPAKPAAAAIGSLRASARNGDGAKPAAAAAAPANSADSSPLCRFAPPSSCAAGL